MENRKRYLAQVLCLAAVYYGAAKLGLSFAFETPSVSAVWAPTSIALAALVLFGSRLWPGVALGALLANAWTGVPLLAVLGITAGNTLEALAGAYLLTAAGGLPPPARPSGRRPPARHARRGSEHDGERDDRHRACSRPARSTGVTSAPRGVRGGSATWAAISCRPGADGRHHPLAA